MKLCANEPKEIWQSTNIGPPTNKNDSTVIVILKYV